MKVKYFLSKNCFLPFCQKIVFCVYLANYTHFGKNNDILRSPEKKMFFCQKIVVCLYLPNYTHCGKNNVILRSPEKKIFFSKKSFFAFIWLNIHISAKITIFWEHLKKINFLPKNRFLSLSAKLYTFRQK